MQSKRCDWCSIEFSPKRKGQRYCSPPCGYDAKRKPRTEWPPKDPIPCHVCGSSFYVKAANQKYCSGKCIEKVRYRKLRDDPEKWEKAKIKARARYEPRPKRTPRLCSVPDCDRKHCARGFCVRHYRQSRTASGETDGHGRTAPPRILLNALAKRYDESGEFREPARETRVAVAVTGSLVFVRCPNCSLSHMRAFEMDSFEFWDCICRTRVRLNQEEVEWAISERRSIEARKPTPN